ncbi:MAG: hypothetical protein WDN03_14935 [Rhizomicrobium sp.]
MSRSEGDRRAHRGHEYRHYKLFYETLNAQDEPDLPFWKKVLVAAAASPSPTTTNSLCLLLPRMFRSADMAQFPYRRAYYARAATNGTMRIYRRAHIQRLVQMVAKAIGAAPHGRLAAIAGAMLWRLLRLRAGSGEIGPAPVATSAA